MLKQILDAQRANIKVPKYAKSNKNLPQILTMTDGFADRPEIVHTTEFRAQKADANLGP